MNDSRLRDRLRRYLRLRTPLFELPHSGRRAGATLALGALLAFGGCQKANKPKVHGASQAPAAKTPAAASEAPTPEDEGSVDETAPTLEPGNPRLKAMEDAYIALVRADDTAIPTVMALGEDTRSVIVRAVESENIRGSAMAVKALVKIGEVDDEVQRLLRLAMDNTAASVRIEALDAAAQLDAKAVLPSVHKLLSDEELTVRATACDAVANLGKSDKQVVERLLMAVQDSEDVVRAACADAMGAVADRETWRPKVAKLLLGDSVPAKEGALRVLMAWPDAVSFDLIRGRLADESPVVVSMALAAISRFGDNAALKEVERFLKDERLSVRVEAVAALSRLPAEDVRRMAYEALKDREAVVRIEAASLLSRFDSDPETWIRLHALLRDEDPGVRSAAVLAIGELAHPRSFGPLTERLPLEPEEAVRTDIVEALAESAPKRAIPHFIDRLKEPKGPEHTAVLRALRETTGQEFAGEAEPWRTWYDETQKGGGGSEDGGADGSGDSAAPKAPEGATAKPAGEPSPEKPAP